MSPPRVPVVAPTQDVPALALPSWLEEQLRAAPVLRELAGEVVGTFAPWTLDGLPPSVKDQWQQKAMAAAGIDPAKWDPSKGFPSNEENIKKVYALYAKWYLEHPELKWAGMAKLAGGTVYGGLLELRSQRPSDEPIRLGDVEADAWVNNFQGLKQTTMDNVERIFVGMQKNIFMDLAWQHQAYVEGGLSALKQAYDQGELSAANYEAWQKIASTDENARWEGNKTLLLREQSQVLPPDYERIQDMLGGGTITKNISEQTKSPIPGGDSFHALYPHGDVTDFEDRWKWIEGHMLPEYKALGGEYTRTLVSQPLDELAKGHFAPNPNRPR